MIHVLFWMMIIIIKEMEKNCDDVPPTKRLAVVNCDWDNITTKDYMIFRSFLPIQGDIVKVTIHPSEYGVKMMKTRNSLVLI